MTDTNSRPVAITVICIIGFIGILPSILLVFSPQATAIGAWYPPFLAFSTIVGLISFIGLWMMKKWGVYLYAALTTCVQVVLLAMGVWNPFTLIIPLVIVIIGFTNLPRMA